MGKQYEKKITWTIKNFSSLQYDYEICSDYFVVSGCKWCLRVYPKGNKVSDNHLSLYLYVADSESLPCGWRRHVKFGLTIVDQLQEELSKKKEPPPCWFDQKNPSLGYGDMLPLTKLQDKDGGFLVNNELKVIAELDVLKVIGKSNALEEETKPVMETIDVNGFQVLPSQVESVNNLFENHPNIASRFSTHDPYLKTTYLNVLLRLTEILSKSPEELSIGDLAGAYSLLRCVENAGFKLDWLEKKLKEVGENRIQEIEEELKYLKRNCSDMDSLLEFLR